MFDCHKWKSQFGHNVNVCYQIDFNDVHEKKVGSTF